METKLCICDINLWVNDGVRAKVEKNVYSVIETFGSMMELGKKWWRQRPSLGFYKLSYYSVFSNPFLCVLSFGSIYVCQSRLKSCLCPSWVEITLENQLAGRVPKKL